MPPRLPDVRHISQESGWSSCLPVWPRPVRLEEAVELRKLLCLAGVQAGNARSDLELHNRATRAVFGALLRRSPAALRPH